jgi:hypothetical protein
MNLVGTGGEVYHQYAALQPEWRWWFVSTAPTQRGNYLWHQPHALGRYKYGKAAVRYPIAVTLKQIQVY